MPATQMGMQIGCREGLVGVGLTRPRVEGPNDIVVANIPVLTAINAVSRVAPFGA